MIDGAGEEEEINACDQWVLPSAGLEGVRCSFGGTRARVRGGSRWLWSVFCRLM